MTMTGKKRIKIIDELQQEINSHRPFKKKLLQNLKEYYRIGLTYTSNALEGNSLTETETKIILEEGITIGGKPLKDHFEAIGHGQAYDAMLQMASKKTITEKNILDLHRLFYYRIDLANAGKYRKEQVFITGTTFMPPAPDKVTALMKRFVTSLPSLEKKHHPVVYAALVHKEFVTIHPFVDGNGRCGRLLMNLALLQHGYEICTIPPVRRHDYINALKKAQTARRSDEPFIEFIAEMTYESQKDYLRLIRAVKNSHRTPHRTNRD